MEIDKSFEGGRIMEDKVECITCSECGKKFQPNFAYTDWCSVCTAKFYGVKSPVVEAAIEKYWSKVEEC